ncbi:MAG: flagellar hook-basal body complex protein [Pseudomonadota bacterium]
MAENITSGALTEYNAEMKRQSANVAGQRVAGFKAGKTVFSATITNGQMNGVKTKVLNQFTDRGVSITTDIATDFIVDGEGMAIVRSGSNEVLYTQACSFRIDHNGKFVNHEGYVLQGWEVDAEGNIPANSAQLESLKPISTRNIAARAGATTKVELGMNWEAGSSVLQGTGSAIRFSTQGANQNTRANDIILPEDSDVGGIQPGDQFILQASNPVASVFEYGGISSSRVMTQTNTMYGAYRSDTKFTFSTAPQDGTLLKENDALGITVGGRSYTLYATPLASTDDSFNSLETLASRLNRLDGVVARVVGNNKIYVASTNANDAITFTNGGSSGNIRQTLGLFDVAGVLGTTQRFATLKELEAKISQTDTLGATLIGRSVNFFAASALDELTVTATSTGLRTANTASIGDNTERGRRSVTITAHDNELVAGDFVRIKDFAAHSANGAIVADGIYRVMAASSDGFTIASQSTVALGAAASAFAPVLTTDMFSYQKVAGQIGTSVTIAAGTIINTTDANTLVINNNPLAGYAGAALAAQDIVYISGFGLQNAITVPDGYYEVTAVGVGDITLTATGCAAGPLGPFPSAGAITIQKVGRVLAPAALVNTMDTLPITTTAASDTVRMYIPNHNYIAGNIISLGDLATTTVTSNGVVLTKDKHYEITAVGAGYIEFVADTAAGGAAAVTAGAIGYTATSIGAGPLTTVAATILGTSTYVDKFSRFYSELGLVASNLENTLPASYNPSDSLHNFAGGEITKNVHTHAVTVYDSLGNERTVMLGYARLNENQWAVEVYGINDEYGDPQMDIITEGKTIAYGTITFDGSGGIYSISSALTEAIQITWNGGADPSAISINWGAIGGFNEDGTPGTTGITQVAAPFDVRFVNQDGQAAGRLVNIQITEDGYIVAQFDNGTSQKVFQIAIATFDAMNGLDPLSGMVYRSSLDSGAVRLVAPGAGIKIISGSIEGSNVDSTNSMLELMDLNHIYGLNTSVIKKQEEANQALLRAFG